MSSLKYSIIPKPQRYDTVDGTYTVTQNTAVLCVTEFKKAGMYLSNFLKTNKDASDGAIKFNKDDSMRPESYKLRIDNSGITVTASDERGAFYGAVTLKIIILQGKQSSGKAVLNGADIYDYPKYEHRGGMVDDSRHFFGKDAVMHLIDDMAMLKLNKLHWHLSDDQGYRIESEEFPLLNEIASNRKYEYLQGAGTMTFMKPGGAENYHHYYKKDEIREVVAYAAERCIDIIPEIDMPGHTIAFIAAYKELSCRKKECEVFGENGITEDILCAGSEETYVFVEKLLKEVCELFPYKYFHIGGDEASKGHKIWEKECPACQKAIADNGLRNGEELQEYFINRVNRMLNDMGKTCIEWNDGIGDNTDGNIVCHYWIKRSPAWLKKEATRRKLIVSPTSHFYFDMSYAQISLKKMYKFNPAKAGLAGHTDSILGIEFESWAEWITDESALQFALYPRIFAMAENAWTEDEKMNYRDFYKRLDFFKGYIKAKGVNFSRVEKSKLAVRNRTIYHLGKFGPEYKYNEKLKSAE